MIHCDRCGEDYAASYKSCPFCDEMEYEEEGRPPGGWRAIPGAAVTAAALPSDGSS